MLTRQNNRMETIFKYELEVVGEQFIKMPVGAKFLHMAEQRHKIAMWWVVDTEVKQADKLFVLYGTGATVFTRDLTHLGTVLMYDGACVWHIFTPN